MKNSNQLLYLNSTIAFLDLLELLNSQGNPIFSRNGNTKEITSICFSIVNSLERTYIIPNRRNNIFSTIAESLWVLAGRDDMKFISRYLQRAMDFSDDGLTWRAGYGARIRNWHNKIDQTKEVYKILLENPNSRRAVISIFDPEMDFFNSKDIPCNNWLNFILRNNRLDLNIAVRSNDIFWGFSGINTFEWSLLLEIMSYWLNAEPGVMHFFTGSLHIYERHYTISDLILGSKYFRSVYSYDIHGPKFQTNIKQFDGLIDMVFSVEELMREGMWNFDDSYDMIQDPLFKIFVQLLGIYNLFLENGSKEKIGDLFAKIPTSDLKLAGIEFFYRKFRSLDWVNLNNTEKEFLSQFL